VLGDKRSVKRCTCCPVVGNMGGATSKLDVNDWEKADGKLRGPFDTIDGEDATKEFSIYHLTKRGVNQREFDITDEESNLVLSTKQVPGTIACFDVSGAWRREISEDPCRILRVCCYSAGRWKGY
jgi:hypothetical protein